MSPGVLRLAWTTQQHSISEGKEGQAEGRSEGPADETKLVECLPDMCRALSSVPSTLEAETRGSKCQSHLQLHSKFNTNLGIGDPITKTKPKKGNRVEYRGWGVEEN